ncbi:exodeoxyribonuclease V subunit alpha [Castellaniella sp. FW104-16D08]|uniref:exodeoxyribonuclease V subunit alpha n=1 Tax=unclassified Castellaniella TaxID=2617606 RepID=UPI003314F7E5
MTDHFPDPSAGNQNTVQAPYLPRGQSGHWPDWLQYGQEDPVRNLDVAFARFLAQHDPSASPLALRLGLLCSAQLAQGHVCLDLMAPAVLLPASPERCLEQLASAVFVGDGTGPEPLVLHDTRLYLARYWHAGTRIRNSIASRLLPVGDPAVNVALARQWLDTLFPPAPKDTGFNWQKLACAMALRQRFSIITGGPGTGKTTTVVRLLAILQGLAQAGGVSQGLRIRLAAPTGKAAARLSESISDQLQALLATADLVLKAALDSVPSGVQTVHRLLGSRPDTRQMRHHAGHPLDVDVLVIDEASMLDIEMADAVTAALPPHARLILLGDKDQLASVEAGAVLGELCRDAEAMHYTEATCRALADLSGQDVLLAAKALTLAQEDPAQAPHCPDLAGSDLSQAVVMLRHSRRFGVDSGIGRFAGAVNQGDIRAVRALLHAGLPDLQSFSGAGWLQRCEALSASGYPAVFSAMRDQRPGNDAGQLSWDHWALELLHLQTRFQVLCGLRDGPWGVQGLNQQIHTALQSLGWVAPDARQWYAGQPVLVRRNLPHLGLANGDMGLVLPVPGPSGKPHRLRVAFAGTGLQKVRWVSPARLPDLETAYALTVHKSQGSEFDRVVLVMPDQAVPLVTRELLYTGATRARKHLALVLPGGDSVLGEAVLRRTRRAGGIWDP